MESLCENLFLVVCVRRYFQVKSHVIAEVRMWFNFELLCIIAGEKDGYSIIAYNKIYISRNE
jgi:hypothetical protein